MTNIKQTQKLNDMPHEEHLILNIKTLYGEKLTVDVLLDDKISELKKKINDKIRSDDKYMNDVKIIFKGKQLNNDSTIDSNNLKNNDELIIFTIYKHETNEKKVNEKKTNKKKHKKVIDSDDESDSDDNIFIPHAPLNLQNMPIHMPSPGLINMLPGSMNMLPPGLMNMPPGLMHMPGLVNMNYEDNSDDDNDDNYDDAFTNITYKATPEEQLDINELMSLGFPESLVVQVYVSCDKNKDSAASILFSS